MSPTVAEGVTRVEDGLPHPYVLLFGVPALMLVIVVALIVAARRVLRRRPRLPRRGWVLTMSAIAVAACALPVYAWGFVHLIVDEGLADQRCKSHLSGSDGQLHSGYRTSYLPLRFGCRLSDGRIVEAGIPGWINPTLAVLAGAGVLLGATGRVESEP